MIHLNKSENIMAASKVKVNEVSFLFEELICKTEWKQMKWVKIKYL
jgi:hypothetical protein